MSSFKTKWFSKWANKARLSDSELRSAIKDFFEGKGLSGLGGGLYKIRVKRKGHGKSGSYRTIIAYEKDGHLYFIFAFAKNEKSNLTQKEFAVYKTIGKTLMSLSEEQLRLAIERSELVEVKDYA